MATVLKILSGPHAGAEVELADGEYRIGSDDASDIVLTDAAITPGHARLRLNNGAATVAGETGAVLVNSAPIAAETPLGEFIVFTLGGSHLAIGPADAPWPALSLPELFHLEKSADKQPDSAADAAAEEPLPSGQAAPSTSAETVPLPSQQAEPSQATGAGTTPSPEVMQTTLGEKAKGVLSKVKETLFFLDAYDWAKNWKRALRIAALAAAGVLLLVYASGPSPASVRVNEVVLLLRGQNVRIAAESWSRRREPGVLRASAIPGGVAVRGVVPTQETAELLKRLTETAGYPVEIDVRIVSQTLGQLQAEFASRGLSLTAAWNNDIVTVTGYVPGEAEAKAVTERVETILDGMAELNATLVTWAELEPVLRDTAAKMKLSGVSFIPERSGILVRDTYRGAARNAWQAAAYKVQERLGVPIPFRLATRQEELVAGTNLATEDYVSTLLRNRVTGTAGVAASPAPSPAGSLPSTSLPAADTAGTTKQEPTLAANPSQTAPAEPAAVTMRPQADDYSGEDGSAAALAMSGMYPGATVIHQSAAGSQAQQRPWGVWVTAVEMTPAKRFRDERGAWHGLGQLLENGYRLRDVYAAGIVLHAGENLIIVQMD